MFTFVADPEQEPQASAFWPLLTGGKRVVIQPVGEARQGRPGIPIRGLRPVDQPRIVQVRAAPADSSDAAIGQLHRAAGRSVAASSRDRRLNDGAGAGYNRVAKEGGLALVASTSLGLA